MKALKQENKVFTLEEYINKRIYLIKDEFCGSYLLSASRKTETLNVKPSFCIFPDLEVAAISDVLEDSSRGEGNRWSTVEMKITIFL
jgi:hypothetical protein